MYRVLKFGGSSVASATAMSRVLDIVEAEAAKGCVILVSSAISGCTDSLLSEDDARWADMERRHQSIVKRLFTGADREVLQQKLDALFQEMRQAPQEEKVTFGELFSTTILAAKLASEGYKTVWLDSRDLVVKDNEPLTYERIQKVIQEKQADVFVAPGFICRDQAGNISTLGRGGSDYTAALYAAAVGAGSLQIWTDVPGIMTANPKEVPAARTIPRMSYAAALEMASHGAKVLYAPTVAPAMAAKIDIEIRNTFVPDGKFTVVNAQKDASQWVGVASEGETIRLVGTREAAEAKETIFNALQEEGIQARSIQKDGNSFVICVRKSVLEQALKAIHRAFFQDLPVAEVNLFLCGDGAVAQALIQMVQQSASTVKERTGKSLRIVG
ncbi:MAG TPA: hypothetical protein DCF48_04895, partial [Rikenellaceae bacterium]|nr:hypothetical protein [Rikenellaceae bacterium]